MAIFEFKAGQHYHGMWRANFARGDFLAFMWREEGKWIFRYRFRYFKDAKVWESDDERSTWQLTLPDEPGNREKMFAAIQLMLNHSSERGLCDSLNYFPCDGDAQAMINIMEGVEGIHMKRMTAEEHEEYVRTNKLPKEDPKRKAELISVIAKMQDHFEAFQTAGGDDRTNLAFKMIRLIRGWNETNKRKLLPTRLFNQINEVEAHLTDNTHPHLIEGEMEKLLTNLRRYTNEM